MSGFEEGLVTRIEKLESENKTLREAITNYLAAVEEDLNVATTEKQLREALEAGK